MPKKVILHDESFDETEESLSDSDRGKASVFAQAKNLCIPCDIRFEDQAALDAHMAERHPAPENGSEIGKGDTVTTAADVANQQQVADSMSEEAEKAQVAAAEFADEASAKDASDEDKNEENAASLDARASEDEDVAAAKAADEKAAKKHAKEGKLAEAKDAAEDGPDDNKAPFEGESTDGRGNPRPIASGPLSEEAKMAEAMDTEFDGDNK